MKYLLQFGHRLGRIQHIARMSRIELCYATCHPTTQTVAPTLPCFQGIKRYVQYMLSHSHKPIFYPSYSYYGSNVIRLTWIGNQVDDHKTQNCLEYHQDADHTIILNRRRQFQVLYILCLVFLSDGNYRFNHI